MLTIRASFVLCDELGRWAIAADRVSSRIAGASMQWI